MAPDPDHPRHRFLHLLIMGVDDTVQRGAPRRAGLVKVRPEAHLEFGLWPGLRLPHAPAQVGFRTVEEEQAWYKRSLHESKGFRPSQQR